MTTIAESPPTTEQAALLLLEAQTYTVDAGVAAVRLSPHVEADAADARVAGPGVLQRRVDTGAAHGGYYVIFAVAGHDTTSSALAGALRALIDHPDQLARLQDDPDLVRTGVDELIRWVSPVKHFTRTAAVPFEVGGQPLGPGEMGFMSYPAANRDPEVFDHPMRLDVGRTPNDHLAFGFGAHYCLGAQLAKMELRALLTERLPRLRSIELDGRPELIRALMVGGLEHLPVRYEVR